jgi:hypothetical protein
MASRDPTVSKQVTAGKRQHPTLTVPQEREIIRRPESGKSWLHTTSEHYLCYK